MTVALPKIVKEKFARRNRRVFGHPVSRWTEYRCSHCQHNVHPTAKVCPGCGGKFKKGRK